VLAALAGMAELIVVSTGPLHLSAGALVWTRAGDASILVAVRDQSRRDDLTYAVEGLRLVGVTASGTILAERRRSFGRGLGGSTRSDVGEPLQAEPPAPEPIVPEPATATATAAPAPVIRTTRTRRRGSAGQTGT
jgi:hypothetical protein